RLHGFLNTDFTQFDTLIARGYDAGKAHIPEILSEIAAKFPHSTKDREKNADMLLKCPIAFESAISTVPAYLDSLAEHLCSTHEKSIAEKSFRETFLSASKENNYPFCSITGISVSGTGTIVRVNPGIVATIEVTGNNRTSSRLIKSLLDFKTGTPLTGQRISNSIASIYGTSLFENVNIAMDSSFTARIYVTEKKYLRARAAFRFDEFHLAEGYVQPAYENLFGEGICASLHLQYGLRREKYAFELAGHRPFFRKLANMAKLQLYVSREKIRERAAEQTADTAVFDTFYLQEQTLRKAGIIGLIGANAGNFAMLECGVRIEQFKVHQSDRSIFEDPLSSFRDGIRYLMLRLTVDNIDRFPFPQKGGKHYISIGGAYDAIGGTESFLKTDASGRYYFTLAQRHTLAPKIHLSWSNNSLPNVERLFLGGTLSQEKFRDMGIFNHVSFCGLPPRAWPGDIVFMLEGAYRFRVHDKVYLQSTVDWGYAWREDAFSADSRAVRELLNNAPVGLGLGIALETLIGPIRFSWGRLIHNESIVENLDIGNENRFYFSIGHDF
ncbi:MAG: BamA/TamA family outer membrane protein, partial [Chitinivibrionales bacterium]|nr:BamA/TamA family outer membrane protein [Chitinivibrionales bacterium]